MNIWILTRPEYHQMHHIRRLKEEAEKSKIEFHLMDPNQFDIIVTKEGKKSIRYEGNDVQLPDCVISRISPVKNYFTQAVIRKLESLGVFTLNASTSMELARDKLATLQCLAQHNIPIPKTMLAKFPLNIESIEREFTYPLIFKSVSGSKGKGVFLCENRNKLEDIQDLLEMSNPKDIQAILQEFIADSKGKDIRVLVIGGRAIGAIMRTAQGDSFKANIAGGATATAVPLNPAIEWLAVESTRILGLEIAGVDILIDGSTYKVCEVNSMPGFEGFEKATNLNIASEIFKYIHIRLGKNSNE